MAKIALTGIVAALVSTTVMAEPMTHATADEQALGLAEKAIALRSVRGVGNQTPGVALLYKTALIAGGFAERDVELTPLDDTAYLVARWPGQNPDLRPLVISGHMDVVEAKPADWQRDPFKPIEENGYLFGRGATDMKLDGTVAIAALIELKRGGYLPRRDIILEFSGDEETTMRTSSIIADKLANAELVLNMDGSGGVLDERTGKPEYFTWKAAEKAYADFQLTVTNPGGHSSEPRDTNAINQLAAALVRIGNYRFTPELNELTRTYFTSAARYEDPKIATAMRAFAADPADKQAIATLAKKPSTVGKIGTTCVVTTINGGHALNALPQRADANINCRIFPGHNRGAIMAELERVAAEPAVSFKDVTAGSVATDASPLRTDVSAAVSDAVAASYPGVAVFPSMSSGASDSMWFRYHHVPSYGISPLFIKSSENFSHGLNERTPLADVSPSVNYCLSLFRRLSD